MKVHGKVTRVVEGKVFFRPVDLGIYRRLSSAHLTASGEIVVDAGDEKHEVDSEGDFQVAVDPSVEDVADETKEVPPQGDAG